MRIRGPLVALAGLAALAAWWALSRPAPDPESARGGAASLGRAGDDASAQRAGPELAVPPSAAEAGERARTSVQGTLVLAGRVVFGDGRAAYSAPMTLRAERDPTLEVRAVSGVDGTFRIALSERGPYRLYAEKARGSIVASAGEIVCRTELAGIVAPTLDLRVELAAPFELRGRVLDAFGAPLPEARLCAVPLGPDGAPSSSPSFAQLRSPEGVFSLILPHGGAWRIGALARCRVPAQEREFQVSGLHTGLELVCGVPATVLGRVLDDEGRALARARVHGARQSDELDFDFVGGEVTDEDGAFRLGCLLSGEQVLWADAADFVASEPVRLELAPGEVREGVLLQARRGAKLVGTVTCRFADAERWAAWELERLEPRGPQWGVVTHSSGTPTQVRSEVSALPPGEYRAVLVVRDRLGERRLESRVTLSAGATTELAWVDQALPAIAVSGRVLAAGAPRPQCELAFERVGGDGARQQATCDGAGRFACELPAAGPWRVRCQDDSGTTCFEVELPDTPAWSRDFELGGASLAGRVVAESTLPAGVQVELSSEPGSLPAVARSAPCDAQGGFAFEVLPPGRYVLGLRVLARGYGDGPELMAVPMGGLELAPGQRRTGVELRLRDGARVVLRARADWPATWYLCDRERPRASAPLGIAGGWARGELGGLPPGRARVFVVSQGSVGRSPWLELELGARRELELELQAGGWVAPRVVFGVAPGEPEWIVRDTEELAFVPCWPALDARVGTKHGPLLPGDYELVARAGGRELSQRFSVRAGETTQVGLRFE